MSFLNESIVKMNDSKYFETPRVLPKRRSSIFALDLEVLSLDDQHEISVPGNLDAYNQKLQREILEWTKLLKQKNGAIKKLHDQEHVVNESVLSDTQKNFLNGSIDIAKFAMDSREFQDICNYYMLRKEMFLMRKEYYMELLEEKYTSKVMSLADMLINQSES